MSAIVSRSALSNIVEMIADAPIRVLVVEDNFNDQELLQREMRKAGLAEQVHFVSDPLIALDFLQGSEGVEWRRNLKALFLDVHLPHMTGPELLRIIRSMEGMEQLPVIVMTSAPHPDTIAICRELHVRAFLEKPVKFRDFSKVMGDMFHQAVRQPNSEMQG